MATNNAHVFISYSRRNIDFAKLLFRELNKSKRDVWVDWEDIPRGADWLQEIYSGIDNADTFIFLVSEHSLASEICNRELAYALQHNKKIIPLILQEINEDVHQRVATKWQSTDWNRTAQSNWNALKHINWIFFNNPAKYNSEFQALLNTVDQDLFHIKTHTRLLVRAQEWHNAERNPSSLLQGDDLISAEFWLKTYAEADPIPTQLHKEFIQASREQENDNLAYEKRLQNQAKNRLQILVGSFAVLLGVIVFALLPLINTQLEFRLADDIDFRLSEAALSFRDLLDDDEELALVSALFVANVDLVRELADDNVSAQEFDREIAPIRDDFDLQEVSFFWASFDYGTEPVYFIRPEINHNERVQQLREDLVLDALEFEDDVSDIVIGSPESQIIAAAPVYRTDSDDLIGAVLVAYHIDDEYISEIADILDIEAIIANIENQIVVTTISTPPEIADSIRSSSSFSPVTKSAKLSSKSASS
ncbi:MAG: toll/interleukin-1 receptor domain-containing protein [Chloroflexota bacterium]